jgi:hypothetical protein
MTDDLTSLTPAQLIEEIEQLHPAAYYILAAKLFQTDQKDEAVFWFYTGQIRYRCYLAAHPDLEPSGDPALFGALSAQVGEPLNVYAFGDVPKLAETITRALEWDAAHPDAFTDRSVHASACEDVRNGLVEMRQHILDNEDQIKQSRKEAGLA